MQWLRQLFLSPPSLQRIDRIEESLKSLPHLPPNISGFFVSLAPWVALIAGSINGFISFFILLSLVVAWSHELNLTIIPVICIETVLLLSTYLLLASFIPLLKKEVNGWVFLFWANVFSIPYNLCSMVIIHSVQPLQFIIMSVAGFYLLREIRPRYHTGKL